MKINSFAMVAALMNLANAELQPEAKFRVHYTPNVIDVGGYPRVIAPDTPYVAAAGRDRLYFIDTRFDPESAAHIKQQIEWASVPDPDTYIQIDEIAITAEVRSASTNEVLFTFDPPYARVLFAAGINRKNPDAKLPEHMEAGDHIVRYDIGTSLLQKRLRCRDFGCWSSLDCLRDTGGVCDLCHHYYVNRESAM